MLISDPCVLPRKGHQDLGTMKKKMSDDQSMLDTFLCAMMITMISISTIIELINITMENNRNSQNQEEKMLISSKRSRLIIRSN